MMALINIEMNDVSPARGEYAGSQLELGPDEILAPVRMVPLTVDDDSSVCKVCIAEGIKCGVHHQVN